MGVVALIIGLFTAGAGLYMLAVWLIEYDRDTQSARATRIPIPVISSHAVLAVTGLAAWSAYLLLDSDRLAWATVVILGCVVALGLTMAVRWIGVYRSTGAAGGRDEPVPAGYTLAVPPERNFPVSVVVSHGILAMATLVLVLLTTLEIWG